MSCNKHIRKFLSVFGMFAAIFLLTSSVRPEAKSLFVWLKSGSAACEVNIHFKMFDDYQFDIQHDFREEPAFCYLGYRGDQFSISTLTVGYRLDYDESENYHGTLEEENVTSRLMIRVIE